jgi:hypothetical protein
MMDCVLGRRPAEPRPPFRLGWLRRERRLAGLDARSGKDFQISSEVKHLDTGQGQDTDRPRFGCMSRLADRMSIFALART